MVIAQLQAGQAPANVVLDIVRRLEKGEVLILPTDTVYGLHALARNSVAVEKIRQIKGISDRRPFVNLYSSVVGLGRFVQLPEGEAKRKILEGWPGSVTWVLPAREGMPDHILGEDGTLGIRIPDNQLLRSVCSALDDLIVSTSANKHGFPTASERNELDPDVVDAADGVVYQIEPLSGHPSEVKRWTPAGPEVLRSRDGSTRENRRQHVLIVCSGNICRSPMAEAMLRRKLQEKAADQFVVRSAGTLSQEGIAPQLSAIQVMDERNLNLRTHRSRAISRELMEWADVVLVMTTDHLGELHDRFGDMTQKVFLFTSYPSMDVEGLYGVPDPYGSSTETYEQVARTIEQEIDRIADTLISRIVLKQ